jgi:hypothetical protein
LLRPSATPETIPGATLEKSFPPELVFRRAFWRRPACEDRILHAALREWLATVPALSSEIPNPPAWFPKNFEQFTIQRVPSATCSS